MGYVMVTAPCFGCGKVFTFHPNKVPSINHDGAGRRPVCLECVERVNPMRAKNGLPLIEVMPGAYEAAHEDEINWSDHD